jgi:methyl-accepting chemotaxis protein
MQAFHTWKVSSKLGLGFGLLIVLLLLIGGTAIYRISHIHNSLNVILGDRLVKVKVGTHLDQAINHQVRNLRGAVIGMGEPEELQYSLPRVEKGKRSAEEALSVMRAIIVGPNGRALLTPIESELSRFNAARDQTLQLIESGNKEAAGQYLLKQVRDPQLKLLAAVDAMINYQADMLSKEGGTAQADGAAAIQTTLVLSALALVVAVVTAVLITRSITRQLGGEPAEVVRVANAIAQGDLTVQLGNQPPQQDSVVAAMVRMKHNLTHMASMVHACSEQVASASEQIALGTADLSARTEQQASSLEETAASTEEIASAVKLNAEHTREASAMANETSDAAREGGQHVDAMVLTMQTIAQSSQRIGEIISVIDGIAFQTNILALNAAVEAARAGEQGRGFAVVASEVRSLAQRSAEAAKEIKILINDSISRVATGEEQAQRAGESVQGIVGRVQRVNELMNRVSAATAEENAGFHQISEAIMQLDQVTQQNSALVEESAAAADSLRQQATRLKEAVSMFRIEHRRLPDHAGLLQLAA